MHGLSANAYSPKWLWEQPTTAELRGNCSWSGPLSRAEQHALHQQLNWRAATQPCVRTAYWYVVRRPVKESKLLAAAGRQISVADAQWHVCLLAPPPLLRRPPERRCTPCALVVSTLLCGPRTTMPARSHSSSHSDLPQASGDAETAGTGCRSRGQWRTVFRWGCNPARGVGRATEFVWRPSRPHLRNLPVWSPRRSPWKMSKNAKKRSTTKPSSLSGVQKVVGTRVYEKWATLVI